MTGTSKAIPLPGLRQLITPEDVIALGIAEIVDALVTTMSSVVNEVTNALVGAFGMKGRAGCSTCH